MQTRDHGGARRARRLGELLAIVAAQLLMPTVAADEWYGSVQGVCESAEGRFRVEYVAGHNGFISIGVPHDASVDRCELGGQVYSYEYEASTPRASGICGAFIYETVRLLRGDEQLFEERIVPDCRVVYRFIGALEVNAEGRLTVEYVLGAPWELNDRRFAVERAPNFWVQKSFLIPNDAIDAFEDLLRRSVAWAETGASVPSWRTMVHRGEDASRYLVLLPDRRSGGLFRRKVPERVGELVGAVEPETLDALLDGSVRSSRSLRLGAFEPSMNAPPQLPPPIGFWSLEVRVAADDEAAYRAYLDQVAEAFGEQHPPHLFFGWYPESRGWFVLLYPVPTAAERTLAPSALLRAELRAHFGAERAAEIHRARDALVLDLSETYYEFREDLGRAGDDDLSGRIWRVPFRAQQPAEASER